MSYNIVEPGKIETDGISSFVSQFKLTDSKEFTKHCISKCYYFHPDDVLSYWEKLKTEKGPHSIRYSKKIYADRDRKEEIEIINDYPFLFGKKLKVRADKDGNKNVRDLFKSITGKSVSYGKTSGLRNYTLAHIWGRTNNPFTFLGLWNISLVPTYIASLTDKSRGREGEIYSEFQRIFKAVAWCLYSDKIDEMKEILQSEIPDKKDIKVAKQLIKDIVVKVIKSKSS